MSRTIYISMNTLLAPSEHPDPHLGVGISHYAKPFVAWCKTQGTVCLLTDSPLAHAVYLAEKLGGMPVRSFDLSKTDLLDRHKDFYLVDDGLIPGEVSWFAEHGLASRVVSVDNHGVTPATRDALAARIAKAEHRK